MAASEPKDDDDKDDDLLQQGKDAFKRASDAEDENRKAFLDDMRFWRLSEQWPAEIKTARLNEKRPCLTVNRGPTFIRQVVNDARQNKPSIRVRPVDGGADPDTAKVFNGIIRHIQYASRADVAYDTATDSAVSGGFGYFRIAVKYAGDDSFDRDLVIERVANPLTVYGDPASTAADSSDWNDAFVVDFLEKEEFERRFPKAEKVNWDQGAYAELKDSDWCDGDRVMVAEWYHRSTERRTIVLLTDGRVIDEEQLAPLKDELDAAGIGVKDSRQIDRFKVTHRLMTGAEILETTEWAGQYIPIIPVYGDEVNVEGKRHFRSLLRDAADPQRMLNYWRTTSTELVALAPRTPFIGPVNAFDTDAAKWATINSVSHPFVQYDGPTQPQRQPLDAGGALGAMSEAKAASDDLMAVIGLFNASIGQKSNETSGKAILARQREGDVSTFHFLDNMARAINHAGRILIELIPKVYTPGRVVRILGEDGATTEEVTLGKRAPAMAEQQAMENAKRIYDLSAGKYDLVVDVGPSFTTRREEAANQMMELLRAFPQAAAVIGDLLAKNLDWPGADEIAKRLQTLLPPPLNGQPAPQPPPDPRMVSAQAALLRATSDAKTGAMDAETNRMKAETDRLQTVGPAMTPQAVQAIVLDTIRQILAPPSPPQPQPAMGQAAPAGMPMGTA
ncbi:MAG: hypothetical protein J0H39_13930 [Alphaproteobacteria bacterium]|nr:hypothetical protein [Alphaproteobacteria bacterium]